MLITMRSHERSRATRRISGAGLPTAASYSSIASFGESEPNVRVANCSISRFDSSGVHTDAGAKIGGLRQQRILDREHDQPRRKVIGNRRRVAQRTRRRL